jgi:signal transduction histidine kinase
MATEHLSGGDHHTGTGTGTVAARPARVDRQAWYGARWAVAILLVMVVLTSIAAYEVQRRHGVNAQDQFDHRVEEIEQAITGRMDAYTAVLRGGLGLFNGSDTVTREEWRRYVDTLSVETLWPGIQGIGYAEFVRPESRPTYEQAIRDQGFPNFVIRPVGDREIYSSITFLEPFDERNRQAFGFDMYQQETRRAAMDLARDTGEVAISGRVTLVQEISDDVQAGFLMYLPYFETPEPPTSVAERRDSIVGYVYSPFRMGNLMAGILGTGLPDVRLNIFDLETIRPENLMYDSKMADDPDHSPRYEVTTVLEVGKRPWAMRVTSLRPLEQAGETREEILILAGGLALSFLVFGILWSFATTRGRAQTLANTMTLRLHENTEELKRSNAELELFAYVASHDLKAPLRGIDHLASWIETDLGDTLTGEPKQNMTLLKGRIKRLDALLNDLLDYSRAGRSDTNVAPIEVARSSQEWFDGLNGEGRFELHLAIDIPVLTFAGLEQILINLFSNSIKHHGGETGNIFLTVLGTDQYFEIRYEDDGVGIPSDQRERAFQMFQTLQPRDKVEGSGMGMAIIRKIVERQGGTITCEDRSDGQSGVFFRVRWKRNQT